MLSSRAKASAGYLKYFVEVLGTRCSLMNWHCWYGMCQAKGPSQGAHAALYCYRGFCQR